LQTKWQPVFGMRASSISEELWVFKCRHFDRSVIVLCVRWYLAYDLSLRDLEEMCAAPQQLYLDVWPLDLCPASGATRRRTSHV
jgi:hypothetical protein